MQQYKTKEYKENSILDAIPAINLSPPQIPQTVSSDLTAMAESPATVTLIGTTAAQPVQPLQTADTAGSYKLKKLMDEASGNNSFISPYEKQQAELNSDYLNWSRQDYSSELTGEIEKLLNNYMSREFSYDPLKDTAYKQASNEISRQIMEHMNSRGILPSTMTQDRMGAALSSLAPQYEGLAYERFLEDGKRIMNTIDAYMKMEKDRYGRFLDEGERLYRAAQYIAGLSDGAYKKWKDARDERQKAFENQFKYDEAMNKRQREAVADAWERVRELGYVDNQASIILGVPAGTLSREAKKAKDELESYYAKESLKQQQQLEQIQIKNEAEKELIRLRDELNTQQQKEILQAKNEVEKEQLRLRDELNTQQQLELIQARNNAEKELIRLREENKAANASVPASSSKTSDNNPNADKENKDLYTAPAKADKLQTLQPLTPEGKIMSENDLLYKKYYANAKEILDKKGITQAISYVNSLKLPSDTANKIIDAMKRNI